MICVFFADGFEEIEGITVVDILRRGGLSVKIIGIGTLDITGSHGIQIRCDAEVSQITEKDITGVVIPGGILGVMKLIANERVRDLVRFSLTGGLVTGAICAGPLLLGSMGLLEGRRILCFPTLEGDMEGAVIQTGAVCKDLNLITARGPGASEEFAFALLEAFADKKAAEEVKKEIRAGLK